MKKLVDIIGYGIESISIQDDSFVIEATAVIGEIRRLIKHYKLFTDRVYQDKTVLVKIKALERLVSDRFGLNYQFIFGGTGLITYYNLPLDHSGWMGVPFDTTLTSMEEINNSDTTGDNRMFDSDFKVTLSKMRVEQDKYIKENTITFDRKNAKVINSSKKVIHYIAMDWTGDGYVNSSDREYLAILLQEIGRSIVYLEYSSKISKETINLIEAFKNIKDPKGFKKLIDIKAKEYDIRNTGKSRSLEVMSKMFDVNSDNINFNKDVSTLVDQFTSRFGLAMELVSVTVSMDKYRPLIYTILISYYKYSVYLQLIGLLFTGGFIVVIRVIIDLYILYAFIISIFVIGFGSFHTGEYVEDSMTVRFKKIKEDLQRQIRIIEQDDVFKKEERVNDLLTQIDFVTKNLHYANTLDNPTVAIIDKLTRGDKLNYSKLERSLEALEANPMNALKHRIGNKIKGV